MYVNIKKIPKNALSPAVRVKIRQGMGDTSKLVNLYPDSGTVKFHMVKLRNFEVDSDGSLIFNDGVKITEKDMTLLDGTVVDINGIITYQNIKFYPTGAVKFPSGLVRFPNGDVTLEDGTHIRKLANNNIIHTLPSGLYFTREYHSPGGGVTPYYDTFVMHRQDGYESSDGGKTWSHTYLGLEEESGYTQVIKPLDVNDYEDVRSLPDGTLIRKERQFEYDRTTYERSWAETSAGSPVYAYNVRNPDGTIFTAYGQIINTDGTILDEWYNIHFANGQIRTRDHRFILPDGSMVYSDGAKKNVHGDVDNIVDSPFAVEPSTFNEDTEEASIQTAIAAQSAMHPQNIMSHKTSEELVTKYVDLDANYAPINVYGSVPADFTDLPNQGLPVNTSLETGDTAPIVNDDYDYSDFSGSGSGESIDASIQTWDDFADDLFVVQSYDDDIKPHALAAGESVSYDAAAPSLDHFPLGSPLVKKIDGVSGSATMLKDDAQVVRAIFKDCVTTEGSLSITNVASPTWPENTLVNIDPQVNDTVTVLVEKAYPSETIYYFSSSTGIKLESLDTGFDSEGQFLEILVNSGSASLSATLVSGSPKGVKIEKADYSGVTVSQIISAINNLSGTPFKASLVGRNAKFVTTNQASLATYKDKVFVVYQGLDQGIRFAYSDATSITLQSGSPTSGTKDADGNVNFTLALKYVDTQSLVQAINSYQATTGVKAFTIGANVRFVSESVASQSLDDLDIHEDSQYFVMDLSDGIARNTSLDGALLDSILAEAGKIYVKGGRTELFKIETALVHYSGTTIKVAAPIPASVTDAVVIIDSVPRITELEYKWNSGDTDTLGQYLAWFTFDVDGKEHRMPERSDDLLIIQVFENLALHHAN